ncbi:MAG TPA: lipocalin-like domain-containing protein [Steroidobacteraceae bacterium]|nr:lipocalin-like domain-containing protein [Steroidobacteraceae bacterium]
MRVGLLATIAVMAIFPAHIARAQQPSFAQALTPEPLEFPRDQGPHPDYRQEWWYLTGNLDAADGERFGFELTIFRFALAPAGTHTPVVSTQPGAESSRWRTRQIYLGHFAVSDVARHRFRFAVKLARGALGLAGAQADPFRVWVGNWRIGQRAANGPALTTAAAADPEWHLQAAGQGYVLALTARPLMSPVLDGERGLSRKSGEPGNATYYYSIPRVSVQGTLSRDDRPLQVHGLAWLDREWGSGSLGPQETGWDWFGLQLGDGSCLMFYSLRDRAGTQDPHSAGTWVDSDGRARPLSREDVRIQVLGYWTDARGIRYPSKWRLVMPATGLDITVLPVISDQELVTSPRYWEGAVDVSGTRAGRPLAGRGYVELVGYAGTTAGSVGIR